MSNFIMAYQNNGFYRTFVAKMPYPFSDPYFSIVVLVFVLIVIAVSILEAIRAFNTKKRLKLKQEEAQKLREDKEKERKAEQLRRDEELKQRDEWLKMLVEMRLSANDMSFYEYQKSIGITPSVDEKKSQKEDKEFLALHDRETGLYNQMAFVRHFEKTPAAQIAIIYADINNLSKTNNELGRECGDRLLSGVVSCILEEFEGRTYRKGGDEFVILLKDVTEKILSKKIARIEKALEALTNSDLDGIIYSCAFGICVNDGSLSREEVLSTAEERMYEDKKAKKLNLGDEYVDERISFKIDDGKALEEETSIDEIIAAKTSKNIDNLTGVYNKFAFEDAIRNINETHLTLIYCDIDGLKIVNDKISHNAGDILIKKIASILNTHFKDEVYRLADDDFCILSFNLTEEKAFKRIERIKNEMIDATNNDKDGIFYSASFGCVVNDGEKLYMEMVDECEALLKVDKAEFRSGKRRGVIASENKVDSEVSSEIGKLLDGVDFYNKSYDFNAAPIYDDGSAISSIVSGIKNRDEISDREKAKQKMLENDKAIKEKELEEKLRAKVDSANKYAN